MQLKSQDPELQDYLTRHLSTTLPPAEIHGIVRLLAEYLTEAHPHDWKLHADACIVRLSHGEPVQYITGRTWFYDLLIRLNPAVLIPRPETEELVHWVIQDTHKNAPKILDIGTGSGCIALALKKHLPAAQVTALEISEDALSVARSNAVTCGLDIHLLQHDILHDPVPGQYDIIVSNPPYVSHLEFTSLPDNVRDHEPALALSPAQDDPLIFYKRIAAISHEVLKPNGIIYLELNEFRAHAVRSLYMDMGYATELRKDMQEKWRMMKAKK